MFRQAGPLRPAEKPASPVAGFCIRHLVLPEGEAGTSDILRYLKATFGPAPIYTSA